MCQIALCRVRHLLGVSDIKTCLFCLWQCLNDRMETLLKTSVSS